MVPKWLPLATIVLSIGMAGYTAWPYVGTPQQGSPPAPSAPVPEVTSSLLSPVLARTLERDPFMDPEETQAEAKARMAAMLKSLTSGKGLASLRSALAEVRPKAPGRVPGKQDATATTSSTAAGSAPARVSAPPPDDPREGMLLKLTLIQGDRRVAMINDRVYKVGDTIQREKSSENPCILAQIHPHDVLLIYQGRHITLTYPSSDAPSQATAANPPARSAARTNTNTVTATDAGLPKDAAATLQNVLNKLPLPDSFSGLDLPGEDPSGPPSN
jgi:hypothetical protein